MIFLLSAFAAECPEHAEFIEGLGCRCTGRWVMNEADTECICGKNYYLHNKECLDCQDGLGQADNDQSVCKCPAQTHFNPTSGFCLCDTEKYSYISTADQCRQCKETYDTTTGRCTCVQRQYDWYKNTECTEKKVCSGMQYIDLKGDCVTCPDNLNPTADKLSCQCREITEEFVQETQKCEEKTCTGELYMSSKTGTCTKCPSGYPFTGKKDSPCDCHSTEAVFDSSSEQCACKQPEDEGDANFGKIFYNSAQKKCVVCPGVMADVGSGVFTCSCASISLDAAYIAEKNVCGCAGNAYINSMTGKCTICPAESTVSENYKTCACKAAGAVLEDNTCRCQGNFFIASDTGIPQCKQCPDGGAKDPENPNQCACGAGKWDFPTQTCTGLPKSGLGAGAVVGIVMGVIIALAIIGVVIAYFLRKDLLRQAALQELFEMKHRQLDI